MITYMPLRRLGKLETILHILSCIQSGPAGLYQIAECCEESPVHTGRYLEWLQDCGLVVQDTTKAFYLTDRGRQTHMHLKAAQDMMGTLA